MGEGQRLDYVLPVDDWWVGAGVPVSAVVDESYAVGF
ncbi:hypothetical protein MKMG_01293 [Methanogenium sp. MK-MG]|nr:hypothetical protein MKMG_01293 [Methanogenium sp. MK-MG]